MEKAQITDIVLKIVQKLTNQNMPISANDSLEKDCGLSSIDLIDLIVRIEDEIGFEFNDVDLLFSNFENVSKIVNVIARNIL